MGPAQPGPSIGGTMPELKWFRANSTITPGESYNIRAESIESARIRLLRILGFEVGELPPGEVPEDEQEE